MMGANIPYRAGPANRQGFFFGDVPGPQQTVKSGVGGANSHQGDVDVAGALQGGLDGTVLNDDVLPRFAVNNQGGVQVAAGAAQAVGEELRQHGAVRGDVFRPGSANQLHHLRAGQVFGRHGLNHLVERRAPGNADGNIRLQDALQIFGSQDADALEHLLVIFVGAVQYPHRLERKGRQERFFQFGGGFPGIMHDNFDDARFPRLRQQTGDGRTGDAHLVGYLLLRFSLVVVKGCDFGKVGQA